MKFLTIMCLLISSVALADEQLASAELDRAWGLLLGDVITQHILLPVDKSALDFSSLPQTEKRYGTWLNLNQLQLQANQLLLTYQVINVPPQTSFVQTPALSVRTKVGDFISIAEQDISIGPILPIDGKTADQLAALKPSQSASFINTQYLQMQLTLYLLFTVMSGVILFIWHVGWRPKNRSPFAQAVYDLSRLRAQRKPQPNQAMRILHNAFNQTAQTTVVYSELDSLFETVPWLQSMQQSITVFYKRSTQHFFSRDAGQTPQLAEVMTLAKACRAKEKLA